MGIRFDGLRESGIMSEWGGPIMPRRFATESLWSAAQTRQSCQACWHAAWLRLPERRRWYCSVIDGRCWSWVHPSNWSHYRSFKWDLLQHWVLQSVCYNYHRLNPGRLLPSFATQLPSIFSVVDFAKNNSSNHCQCRPLGNGTNSRGQLKEGGRPIQVGLAQKKCYQCSTRKACKGILKVCKVLALTAWDRRWRHKCQKRYLEWATNSASK